MNIKNLEISHQLQCHNRQNLMDNASKYVYSGDCDIGEEDGNMDLDTPASGPSRQEVKNGVGKDASFGTKLSHALRDVDAGHDYETREPPPAQSGTKAWRDILKMPDITLKSQSKPPPAKGTRQLGVGSDFFIC